MDDDIPPLRPTDQIPALRTQADLHRLWRMLMGPLGFADRSLWMVFLEADGRCTSRIEQVTELPPLPDQPTLEALLAIAGEGTQRSVPVGSVAFLLSRPGAPGVTEFERAWASALVDAARTLRVCIWPVHHANDHELRVVAPDDLSASA